MGCGVTACERPHSAKGYCATHYKRRWAGEPDWDRPIKSRRRWKRADTLEQYVEDRVEQDTTTDCILWTGPTNEAGYGVASNRWGHAYAHRLVWGLTEGPISDDKELDHDPRCEKRCVNVDHLTPRTKQEHALLGWQRGQLDGGWGVPSNYARRSA